MTADEREAEIRDWLSMGENASPSCANCHEHWLLARLDEERRARAAAEQRYQGLREVIGVEIAGLELTGVADLGEVQHTIQVLQWALAASAVDREADDVD